MHRTIDFTYQTKFLFYFFNKKKIQLEERGVGTYLFGLYDAHYKCLVVLINYFILFLCFRMVSNSSSLFMSISNLIQFKERGVIPTYK
jgi:hypothetical protein